MSENQQQQPEVVVPKAVIDGMLPYWAPARHYQFCPVWAKRTLAQDEHGDWRTVPGPHTECDCPRRGEAETLAALAIGAYLQQAQR